MLLNMITLSRIKSRAIPPAVMIKWTRNHHITNRLHVHVLLVVLYPVLYTRITRDARPRSSQSDYNL